jgi:hypothetical protein
MELTPTMPDFWRSSGYYLLRRDAGGRLAVTPDFLRAYFARPELAPVEESCAAEIALHRALLDDPMMEVGEGELAALADPDARENYETVLGLRDRIVAEGSLESCYLALFRTRAAGVPGLFLDQMAHAILRNILDGCDDPIRVRAAELLFRAQKVTIKDGSVMAADEEVVEMRAFRDQRVGVVQFEHIGQLLAQPEPGGRTVELDVLDETTGDVYWQRSDRFDTVLDLGFTKPGLDAFCRVLESWVRHFLGVDISVYPVQAISDEKWSWHVGLDAEATAMLNDLYNGVPLSDDRQYRLLSLFRAEFANPGDMMPSVRGKPVYMGLAMTADGIMRVKPQNLLMNLPLANAA